MKIGIIGGTFNPIHLGHIKLAEDISGKLKLDKVVFVPAYSPPHKTSKEIISCQDRYKMTELAIEEKPNYEISDIEIKRKGTSYSIDTIKEFRKIYGDTAEMFFIVGSDFAQELETWKDVEDLKRLCSFVIATRPGYAVPSRPKNTITIEVDTPDISSTDIRRRITKGEPFEDLIHEEVYKYIISRKLYL